MISFGFILKLNFAFITLFAIIIILIQIATLGRGKRRLVPRSAQLGQRLPPQRTQIDPNPFIVPLWFQLAAFDSQAGAHEPWNDEDGESLPWRSARVVIGRAHGEDYNVCVVSLPPSVDLAELQGSFANGYRVEKV